MKFETLEYCIPTAETISHICLTAFCAMSGDSKLSKVVVDLRKEAEVIYPIVHECYELFLQGLLKDYDLVSVYILVYLIVRKPKSWSNGKLKDVIITQLPSVDSIRIRDTPVSFQAHLSVDYVRKKLKLTEVAAEAFRLVDLFNTLQLSGIKHNADNYINHCMVHWACGSRPVKLMFRIPSPMTVLRQQAKGERVATMFTTIEELSREHKARLTYMRGNIDHHKDPLEFLVHDLKHMENFIDPATHQEQIGFFKCMLLLNNGTPKEYFIQTLKYDNLLWTELEYVISDMNCYSTHLVRYLYAKMCSASSRRIYKRDNDIADLLDIDIPEIAPSAESMELMTERWQLVLNELGMRPIQDFHNSFEYSEESLVSHRGYLAAMALIDITKHLRDQWSEPEAEAIRDFFKWQAEALP